MAESIITQVAKDGGIQSLEKFSLTDASKPPVLSTKKPSRRFRLTRTLLCCFGGESTQPVLLPTEADRYSPKLTEHLLLPPVRPCDFNKKCLIIDLDETLVHSSFKVYVLKRPYVDEFLQRIGQLYECVLFTASLAKYADPVADLLDKCGVFRARLFRDACVFHNGNYVKDLNRLGRDLKKVVIIDNSPASYAFHPDNAIPVQSWFDDTTDRELIDLVPFLERLAKVDNVYTLLSNSNEPVSTFSMTQDSSISSSSVDKGGVQQSYPQVVSSLAYS